MLILASRAYTRTTHDTVYSPGPWGPRVRDLRAGRGGAVHREMALDGRRRAVRQLQSPGQRPRRNAGPITKLDHGHGHPQSRPGPALRHRHAVVRADDGHRAWLLRALPDGRSVQGPREH